MGPGPRGAAFGSPYLLLPCVVSVPTWCLENPVWIGELEEVMKGFAQAQCPQSRTWKGPSALGIVVTIYLVNKAF